MSQDLAPDQARREEIPTAEIMLSSLLRRFVTRENPDFRGEDSSEISRPACRGEGDTHSRGVFGFGCGMPTVEDVPAPGPAHHVLFHAEYGIFGYPAFLKGVENMTQSHLMAGGKVGIGCRVSQPATQYRHAVPVGRFETSGSSIRL